MGWLSLLLGPISNLVSSVVGGIFSLKKEGLIVKETEIITDGMVQSTAIKTQPAVIAAENGPNTSFLGRNWRPISCLIFTMVIVGRFTGYIDAHLPSELEATYVSGMFAVMGAYLIARSYDKRI